MLHAGISAIGTDGAFVGYCLTEINAGILEAIYAGKNLRPDHAPEWLVSRICAAIVDVPREIEWRMRETNCCRSNRSVHLSGSIRRRRRCSQVVCWRSDENEGGRC